MRHYSKLIAFAALLLAGTAASAQGSEIAYVTGGNRSEVHLINADSTGHSLLYTAARGAEIFHVDIRPGGGQLAIEEHVTTKGRTPTRISRIKIIDYDANGVMGIVRTHQLTCLTGSLDYHPSDQSLLYRSCDSAPRIMRLDTTATPLTASDLGLAHNAFIASWIDPTNVLYWADGVFRRASISEPANATVVLNYPNPGALDMSTSGTKGLWSDGTQIRLVDTTAGTITSFQVPGQRGHFSPNDDRVIYVTGSEVGQRRQYVLIRSTSGAGATTSLTGEGSFYALDWRN
jgi:hypothetical protein